MLTLLLLTPLAMLAGTAFIAFESAELAPVRARRRPAPPNTGV